MTQPQRSCAPHPRTPAPSTFAAGILLATLAVASPVLAGPLLVCHPFEIGTARSLPWNESYTWASRGVVYEGRDLVGETEALLTPSTPVIVRMETLRRAAIYASHDMGLADRLLASMRSRAKAASGRDGIVDALASLDAAYLMATFRQMAALEYEPAFRDRATRLRLLNGTFDPDGLVRAALTARPRDPDMAFAAALISAGWNEKAYQTHAATARVGLQRDSLLARNVKMLR